jgi:phosphopantetheine--protein transferase-like protein
MIKDSMMIRCGLGTDLVEIARFAGWEHKPYTQLAKIFSPQEIAHALACPTKMAERFAVRFAAREAFFKALHDLLPNVQIPLLTVLRNVHVTHAANGAPQLVVNWPALNIPADITQELKCTQMSLQLSLTHTKTIALATVFCFSTSSSPISE